MFYGVYELNKKIYNSFYDSWLDWHHDTFCPDTEVLSIIELKLNGKGYTARKQCARDKAMDFQSLFSLYGVDMTYGEVAVWQKFFYKWGKRYGLLREFRENGIL